MEGDADKEVVSRGICARRWHRRWATGGAGGLSNSPVRVILLSGLPGATNPARPFYGVIDPMVSLTNSPPGHRSWAGRLACGLAAALVVAAQAGCSGCSKQPAFERVPAKVQRPAVQDVAPAAEQPAEELASDPATAEPEREATVAAADPAEPAAAPREAARPRDADGGGVAGRRNDGEGGGRAAAGEGAGVDRANQAAKGAVLPGRPRQAPQLTAAEAAALAGRLLDEARAAVRGSDPAAASEKALAAYEQVLPYAATDADCRRLTGELERVIDVVGGRRGPAESVPTRFE
jgi:hypothetical protein